MTTDERLQRLEKKMDFLIELTSAVVQRLNVDDSILKLLREAPTLAPPTHDAASNGE